jgi:hypothetical protein
VGGGGAAAGARVDGGFTVGCAAWLVLALCFGAGFAFAFAVDLELDARGGALRGAAARGVERGGCRLTLPLLLGGSNSVSLDGSVRRPSGVDGLKPRRVELEFMSGTFNSGPSASSTLMSTITERWP